MTLQRPRVCIVTAVPSTIMAFLQGHIRALAAEHDVTLVTNGAEADLPGLLGPHVTLSPVAIERQIALWRDVVGLVTLWRVMRRGRFDVVHSVTPKAGLLSMVAARAAGVPRRFHTFTGQVWVTRRGPQRWLLKTLDRLLASCATQVLADSHSQRAFLEQEGIARDVRVLAAGSVAGVDVHRFAPSLADRARIRTELGVPADGVMCMYLGRLNRDKGVPDLLAAFEAAARDLPNLHLLIAGPDEEGMESDVAALVSRVPGRVHRKGFVQSPEHFMAAADVFCLPSYREGFGVVLIEAAAVALPSIASRIYGITDAVDDGVTGLLHPPGDVTALAGAMRDLAADGARRTTMGEAARARVLAQFTQDRVTGAMVTFYRQQLAGAR